MIKISIFQEDGTILKKLYIEEISDNLKELEELIEFVDSHVGEFTIDIEHFKRA